MASHASIPRAGAAMVLVVDHDAAVREALGELVASIGLNAATFASMRDLVAADVPDLPGCLIFALPLLAPECRSPRCILLARKQFERSDDDALTVVDGLSCVPVAILPKPFPSYALLDAVDRAIAADVVLRKAQLSVAVAAVEHYPTGQY